MADLYQSNAGSVTVTGVDTPGFLRLDGGDILSRQIMLITSVKVDRNEEVQTLKTLSNLYYLYSFGESPGRIMIGGILFLTPCNSSGGSSATVSQLNQWYEQNRAYNKQTPISISIGTAVFKGVLTNFSVSAEMTQFNVAGFNLSFIFVQPSQ